MNFLAHAYLSFGNNDFIVGNLIADMVKGKQVLGFPEKVREGIYLHRAIDAFTDSHPEVLRAKHIFNNTAGRYGSSFLDVAYDHFLALDGNNTPTEGWQQHARQCYDALEQQAMVLPPKFVSMYLYMKKEDWLSNYGQRWMIERSFDRLVRRASYLDDDTPVYSDFEKYYPDIQESYERFFPDLKEYVLTNFL